MGTIPSWTMIIKANGFNYDFSNTNVIKVEQKIVKIFNIIKYRKKRKM